MIKPLIQIEIRSTSSSQNETDLQASIEYCLANQKLEELTSLEISVTNIQQQAGLISLLAKQLGQYPSLQIVCLRINKIEVNAIPESVFNLHKICEQQQIKFYLDIVLDENANGMDALSNSTTLLALNSILTKKSIHMRCLVPIIKPLVFKLEGLFSLANNEGINVLLVPAQRLDHFFADDPTLTDNEKLFIWDFIHYRLLDTDSMSFQKGRHDYYSALLNLLYEQPSETLINTTTILSATTNSPLKTGNNISLANISISPVSLQHDSNSALKQKLNLLLDIAGVLTGGIRAMLTSILAGSKTVTERFNIEEKQYNKALLIGAYGGDHIGDTAILGGVLLRIHKRYGIESAVLMTQRVNHTQHLVDMLNVPVNVSVDEYDWSQIRKHINEVDCVVFAGGPLIDLPKQLIRHLYAASLARKQGKPFIAEGIGPGPFARRPSLFIARKLVRMASYIGLRTTESAQHELMKDLDVHVGQCPAFDYLATRNNMLDRMPMPEKSEIETLLSDTKDKLIIGINIRPIGHLYTAGAEGEDTAAYTQMIENRFEQRFAAGLYAFHRSSKIKPCFVFFPMNAIQFGMSDLLSAYRIKRHLATHSESDIDCRIWQADASLDGVIDLIRHLDVAITMRFHATIFALSQQCKVIGVDYRIGKRDKIAELLDDAGISENCARIDLLTADWLKERLTALCKQV